MIGPDEIARLVPFMDVSEHARYPILGALYHPPGGIIRHDAVVWGYARAADALGVDIHQQTELTGIDVRQRTVAGVVDSRGTIATPLVVNCTAGWSSLVAAMAGVDLPIITHPLQAAVTEPVKPFLRTVVVSGTLHVYVSQTDRGELVFGASTTRSRPTRCVARWLLRGAGRPRAGADAVPGQAAVLRQWAGLCDMTPDFSPIMGVTPVEGLPRRRRLGHLRVQGRPGGGGDDSRADRHSTTPELIAAFDLARSRKAASSERKGRRPSATELYRCTEVALFDARRPLSLVRPPRC